MSIRVHAANASMLITFAREHSRRGASLAKAALDAVRSRLILMPSFAVTAVLAVGGCASQTAQAPPPFKSIVVFDAPSSANGIMTEFRINPNLNRAWVETRLVTHPSEDQISDTYRAFIDGLSYDDATRTLSYESDGDEIICGKLARRGWWLFKYDELRIDNRACRLTATLEERPVDKRYEIVDEPFVVVRFGIR